MSTVVIHPGARSTDPDTSHEASEAKDHGRQQTTILRDVENNGPGTEETILNRIGVRQRSDASSEISALVKGGKLANLYDPRTGKTIKLRNTSGRRALVRGLPSHQHDQGLIERLLVAMDAQDAGDGAKRPANMRVKSVHPVKKAQQN